PPAAAAAARARCRAPARRARLRRGDLPADADLPGSSISPASGASFPVAFEEPREHPGLAWLLPRLAADAPQLALGLRVVRVQLERLLEELLGLGDVAERVVEDAGEAERAGQLGVHGERLLHQREPFGRLALG